MSPLDPPPLIPTTVHRPLLPEIQRGSAFILGDDEIVVADEPCIEAEFWLFQARRNERPNA